MFGIAAALILKNDLRVVVTTENPPKSDQTDVGDKIRDFYHSSLPPTEHHRVELVHVSSIRDNNKTDKDNIVAAVQRLEGNVSKSQANKKKVGVGFATDYIGKLTWSEAHKDSIRTAWGVDESKDQKVAEWLHEKHIPVDGKKIAILWSRFSGKKGDVHLEHDTSFEGMRQLINEALRTNDVVIIAGDEPIKSKQKYQKMTEDRTDKVFNITGFWNYPSAALTAWCTTRNDQFKLYDYLDRKAASVKHLGFRSGNLEAFALIGHTVRYLEEPRSKGNDRMAKWHGKGIGYERIVVTKVPTRSGKHLKTLMGETLDYGEDIARPLWAPGRRVPSSTVKPPKPDVSALTKGFERDDIELGIRSYFAS